ncbi:hypothetical protein TNCV_4617621 [Trichonephila clavipes]|nr:hypothetical protein TNCV_4617621 [Trichonephila clavipes]
MVPYLFAYVLYQSRNSEGPLGIQNGAALVFSTWWFFGQNQDSNPQLGLNIASHKFKLMIAGLLQPLSVE